MTDPAVTDPLERRLGQLLQAYTDPPTTRPFDPVEAARTAMITAGAARRPSLGTGLGWTRRPSLPAHRTRLAAAALVVLVVGVASVGLLGPRSENGLQPANSAAPTASANPQAAAVPEALIHPWQRPYTVAPAPDVQGSGTLVITAHGLTVTKDVPGTSWSGTVAAAGSDAIVVTATEGDAGCRAGDAAAYRWTLDGQGTFLTLAAIGTDPCATRLAILGGTWVRSDLPTHPLQDRPLSVGDHTTTTFAPFGNPASPGRTTFRVSGGWTLMQDTRLLLMLLRDPSDPTNPSTPAVLVEALAQPALAAEFPPGSDCVGFTEEPGVGRSRDELVQAIRNRPSLRVSQPKPVDIGGRSAIQLDVEVAPSWTNTCTTPDGPTVAVPILVAAGSDGEPGIGLRAGMWLRLVLVDLGGGRTVVIAIASAEEGASDPEQVSAPAMPTVESFEFLPNAR